MQERNTRHADRKLLIVTSVGALVAGAFIVAAHVMEIPTVGGFGRDTWDRLHAPGFGLVSIAALLFLRPRKAGLSAYSAALGLSIALAIIAELAQSFSARDASLDDFAADLLGIGGFLALALTLDPVLRKRLPTWGTVIIGGFGVIATSLAVLPLLLAIRTDFLQASARPVVATFDNNWESSTYRRTGRSKLSLIAPPADWPVKHGRIARLEMSGARFGGIQFEPFPNWSHYDSISFLASSPTSESFEVELRINDASSRRWRDGFTVHLSLTEQIQRFEIPFADFQNSGTERELDLAQVASLTLFARKSEAGELMLIDDFRLNVSTVEH